jgi:hypothetical protein
MNNARKVTDHIVHGLNEAIEIMPFEPGPGGASHSYVLWLRPDPNTIPTRILRIEFQNGPIQSPADANGFTNEALLAVVIDRMRGFQSGPFKCIQNAIVLNLLELALTWLKQRTQERMARGVEGSLKP